MKVVVTGTRETLTEEWIEIIGDTLLEYEIDVLVHGGCTGVDKECDRLALSMGWRVVEVRANWRKYGRAAGPMRNRKMIDEYEPELVLAFPIESSRGTRDCIEYAKKKGVPTRVIELKDR